MAREGPVTTTRPFVGVVDDDESVRESLPDLLREFGFTVEAFASAGDFLGSPHLDRMRCLVVDIAMPGMSGPELQLELFRRGLRLPIVFITAHVDEAIRRAALGRGAVECLFKPFSEEALLAALKKAVQPD